MFATKVFDATWQAILESVEGRQETREDRLYALQQAIAKQLIPNSQPGVQPRDVALGLCLVVEESGEGALDGQIGK